MCLWDGRVQTKAAWVWGLASQFITFCCVNNGPSKTRAKSAGIWWHFRISSKAQLSQWVASSCSDHPNHLWLPVNTSNLATSGPAIGDHRDDCESTLCTPQIKLPGSSRFSRLQCLAHQIKAPNNSLLLLFLYSLPGRHYWHANNFSKLFSKQAY